MQSPMIPISAVSSFQNPDSLDLDLLADPLGSAEQRRNSLHLCQLLNLQVEPQEAPEVISGLLLLAVADDQILPFQEGEDSQSMTGVE